MQELPFGALSAEPCDLTSVSYNSKHMSYHLTMMSNEDIGNKSQESWKVLELLLKFYYRYLFGSFVCNWQIVCVHVRVGLYACACVCTWVYVSVQACVCVCEFEMWRGRRGGCEVKRGVWVAHASFRHQRPLLMIFPYNPCLLVPLLPPSE